MQKGIDFKGQDVLSEVTEMRLKLIESLSLEEKDNIEVEIIGVNESGMA